MDQEMDAEQRPTGTLDETAHRPFPLPDRAWTMTQNWNDLLFAHWPIAPATIAALIPPGLDLDTFDDFAWVGVVPFWMDGIRHRIPGRAGRDLAIPMVETFPELNLRTYVRSRLTGRAGVFFFSLDAASLLAVIGARTIFHLPYYFANMVRETAADGTVRYKSRRLLTSGDVSFQATYRGLGRPADAIPSQPGTLEHFLTERYCLFTSFRGRILVGNIHHKPWPLEAAEAEIRTNRIAPAHGLVLPSRPPVLHFSRRLQVYIWPLEADGSV
ncbi:hypothetical protein HDF16_000596 [Granulicella aggregans]|uniref:DUF2071 domain-containing protein n=1 Tax=Granulicella aggregans TaxID=474949 RepID=A0A7W7ZA04_9BACT|nr:DUF2071 domain-containing protein [Granulicella aggregans]MBB5055927.1 hypothetical protein [Granulicella aggregans]